MDKTGLLYIRQTTSDFVPAVMWGGCSSAGRAGRLVIGVAVSSPAACRSVPEQVNPRLLLMSSV